MVWGGLTLAYLGFAGGDTAQTIWQQGVNVGLVATALSLFLPIAARLRRTPRPERAAAALAFAAPGLIASALLALNAPSLLPDLPPAALSRYVALALGACALLLVQSVRRPLKPA
jgi:hypothetical protein